MSISSCLLFKPRPRLGLHGSQLGIGLSVIWQLTRPSLGIGGRCSGCPEKAINTSTNGPWYSVVSRATWSSGPRALVTSVPELLGIYPGVVARNDDPRGLGRVRVTIDSLFDDDPTFWALPMGTSSGKDRGDWDVPEVGAEVVVMFDDGNPDAPYFIRGNHAVSEVPPETDGGRINVKVMATKTYVVVMDDQGAGKMTIIHRPTGAVLEHDGATLGVTVTGTTKLSLTATGQVDITGAVVTIQGRPVIPGAGPI